MATLRSMILDGRRVPESERLGKYAQYFDLTADALRSRDTVLIKADAVARDIDYRNDRSFLDRSRIPCPKPPFRAVWLEYIKPGQSVRGGHLVRRTEIASYGDMKRHVAASPVEYYREAFTAIAGMLERGERVTLVDAISWAGAEGYVWLHGDYTYWLNEAGDYLDSQFMTSEPLPDSYSDSPEDWKNPEFTRINACTLLLILSEFTALHAFARMNAHNVRLAPMAAGAPKPNSGKKQPPSSVWHEIRVTGLPQLRRAWNETEPDGEKRELRFHRVKGHYADYREGKGLFGRLKVYLYIEEHEAGNPERGSVAATYKVMGKPPDGD